MEGEGTSPGRGTAGELFSASRSTTSVSGGGEEIVTKAHLSFYAHLWLMACPVTLVTLVRPLQVAVEMTLATESDQWEEGT